MTPFPIISRLVESRTTFDPTASRDVWSPEALRDLTLKTIEVIRTQAHPFLDEKVDLYRGRYSRDKITIVSPRPDRRPMSSSKELQDALNVLMREANPTVTRNNSLFVTGAASQTSSYGEPHNVFPLGPFDYSWSPMLKDAWVDASKYIPAYYDLRDSNNLDVETILNAFREVGVAFRSNDGSLQEAVSTGNEILISCKSALLIRTSYYEKYVAPMMHAATEPDWDEAYKSFL